MDCSPPGPSVHRILQARILALLPFPPPGDLPDWGIEPGSPALKADSSLTELRGMLSYRGGCTLFLLCLNSTQYDSHWARPCCCSSFWRLMCLAFSTLGCYQYHCYEHLCHGFGLDTCFLFSVVCVESDRMGRLSHRLTLSLTFWKTASKYFPKWLHQLIGY